MTPANKLRAIRFETFLFFKYFGVEIFAVTMGALFFVGVFACVPQ